MLRATAVELGRACAPGIPAPKAPDPSARALLPLLSPEPVAHPTLCLCLRQEGCLWALDLPAPPRVLPPPSEPQVLAITQASRNSFGDAAELGMRLRDFAGGGALGDDVVCEESQDHSVDSEVSSVSSCFVVLIHRKSVGVCVAW